MKKYVALLLALAMAMVLAACGTPAEKENGETKEIQVGTSNVYLTIPADYQLGEMTEEDTSEGQVAYYYSENDLLDFDLYYWAKADGETLDSAAAEETEEKVSTAEFNGISFVFYNDKEESDGKSYPTVTYIMEDGDYFVEFVFWLDGKNAEAKAKDIMATVALKEGEKETLTGNKIRLGTSDLVITTDKVFTEGELTSEDTDEQQVGYYKSEETLLDFDVYYWAKGDGETLESTAAAEAEEYQSEAKSRVINGIATMYYNVEAEESDDGTFPTLTYIIDNGDYLAEIVFWLDGDDAAAEAEAIISTLTH